MGNQGEAPSQRPRESPQKGSKKEEAKAGSLSSLTNQSGKIWKLVSFQRPADDRGYSVVEKVVGCTNRGLKKTTFSETSSNSQTM